MPYLAEVLQHPVEVGAGAARVEAGSVARMRAGVAALGFVVGVVVVVLLEMAVAPPTLKRDMRIKEEVPSRLYRGDGLVNPPDMPYGLNDPEIEPDGTVQRWSTSHATLNFPYEA